VRESLVDVGLVDFHSAFSAYCHKGLFGFFAGFELFCRGDFIIEDLGEEEFHGFVGRFVRLLGR
jgi:hypothetical protein